MKRIILALSVLITGIAQAQDLPQPSPAASFQQTVGLTEISVTYSRPSTKGRVIFGDLVPYNELWRTGANANTIVEFSTDLVFGGNEVKAGKYSLLAIPGKGEWTIILNTKTDMWGTDGYSKVNDVARVRVGAGVAPNNVESFTISVEDLAPETANLVLRWAKTEVKAEMRVDVTGRALKNIDDAIASSEKDKLWRVYRNAANYHYNNKLDLNKALSYMNKSIEENKDSWYSYWLQAEIMAEKGMFKEAASSAKRAMKTGEKAAKEKGNAFGYAEMIGSAIENWKKEEKKS